jgi:glyoxylase-like metal-dependent hydrolase (beta-lactamase superfamily II)
MQTRAHRLSPTRRQAIRALGAAAAGLSPAFAARHALAQSGFTPPPAGAPVAPWAPSASAPAIPSWNTELKQLAANVYAYTQEGGPGKFHLENAGLIVGPDSMMAIDTLRAPLLTRVFIAAARKAGANRPITRVINTHHHGDHVAGNQFFMPCDIVAHEFCRGEVVKMAAAVPAGDRIPRREGWSEGSEDRKFVAPTTTFTDRRSYEVGTIRVELIHLGPAHTWGDIVVHLPAQRILFAGDIFFNYVTPFGQTSHISRWIEVCATIAKMDVDMIVPGHGPVGTRKELQVMVDYYVTLREEVRRRHAARMTPGRAAADIRMERWRNWLVPQELVRSVVRLYAEIDGKLIPGELVDDNRAAFAEYNAIKAGQKNG